MQIVEFLISLCKALCATYDIFRVIAKKNEFLQDLYAQSQGEQGLMVVKVQKDLVYPFFFQTSIIVHILDLVHGATYKIDLKLKRNSQLPQNFYLTTTFNKTLL